jgi:hypothetical protein
MNQVITKIFLSHEPNIETSSHVYSTQDPIEGFITLQIASDMRWQRLTIKLEGA